MRSYFLVQFAAVDCITNKSVYNCFILNTTEEINNTQIPLPPCFASPVTLEF